MNKSMNCSICKEMLNFSFPNKDAVELYGAGYFHFRRVEDMAPNTNERYEELRKAVSFLENCLFDGNPESYVVYTMLGCAHFEIACRNTSYT